MQLLFVCSEMGIFSPEISAVLVLRRAFLQTKEVWGSRKDVVVEALELAINWMLRFGRLRVGWSA